MQAGRSPRGSGSGGTLRGHLTRDSLAVGRSQDTTPGRGRLPCGGVTLPKTALLGNVTQRPQALLCLAFTLRLVSHIATAPGGLVEGGQPPPTRKPSPQVTSIVAESNGSNNLFGEVSQRGRPRGGRGQMGERILTLPGGRRPTDEALVRLVQQSGSAAEGAKGNNYPGRWRPLPSAIAPGDFRSSSVHGTQQTESRRGYRLPGDDGRTGRPWHARRSPRVTFDTLP
jgi:hypothetical protein